MTVFEQQIRDNQHVMRKETRESPQTTAGEGKINNVYLSGGGAKTPMLVEAVQQRLGLPVEIINPFCNVKYNEKEFDPEYINEIGPLVTVAVGLATRRFGDK